MNIFGKADIKSDAAFVEASHTEVARVKLLSRLHTQRNMSSASILSVIILMLLDIYARGEWLSPPFLIFIMIIIGTRVTADIQIKILKASSVLLPSNSHSAATNPVATKQE